MAMAQERNFHGETNKRGVSLGSKVGRDRHNCMLIFGSSA